MSLSIYLTHNFSTRTSNQFQQTRLQNMLSMFPICCGKEALTMVMGIQKAMATGKKWRRTILTAGLGTIGMARPSKSTREVHTCRKRMRRTLRLGLFEGEKEDGGRGGGPSGKMLLTVLLLSMEGAPPSCCNCCCCCISTDSSSSGCTAVPSCFLIFI